MTAGYALFQAANNSAIMASANAAERGIISAMIGLSRNLGLVTGASAMGAVFAYGTSKRGDATGPDAIATGTHLAFAVAAALVVAAILLSVHGAQRRV
jgi:hypothetical protein